MCGMWQARIEVSAITLVLRYASSVHTPGSEQNNSATTFVGMVFSGCVIGIFIAEAKMNLCQIMHGCFALAACLLLFVVLASLLDLDIAHRRALANLPNLKPARPRTPGSVACAR